MKVSIVCKCGIGTQDDISVEINLMDDKIYYYCNKCKKNYEIKISSDGKNNPYPKTKIMRNQ